MLHLHQVDISTKEGTKVGEEVVLGYAEIGGGVIICFNWCVRVRGPEEQLIFIHLRDFIILVSFADIINSTESNEGLRIANHINDSFLCETREGQERPVFMDLGVELGKHDFGTVMEESRSREAGTRIGGSTVEGREDRIIGRQEGGSRFNIPVADCGVGEHAVLHAERLVSIGHLNSSAIEFKGFDDFAGEARQKRTNSKGAIGIQNKNAWSAMNLGVEFDEIVVINTGEPIFSWFVNNKIKREVP